jgi:probable HAF family extracellular repeat protein
MVPGRGLKRIIRVALAAGAAASLFNIDVRTQSAATYGIRDLGSLGGASAIGYDVDWAAGSMVGQAQTASGDYHAFRQGYGGLEDLGTLGGSRSAAFNVIGGLIVGQAQTSAGQYHAFSLDSYQGSAMVDLGTLGGTWSAAYGGDYGIVVGASKTAGDARTQAFSYTNGKMSPLAFDWGGDSVARAVRAYGGLIVGYACTSGNASCSAFAYRDSVATKLGSLGGNSVANAVNYSDQIAGTSALTDPATKHAFLYANGTMTDLGTLGGKNSEGFDINSAGDIVGTSDTAGSGPHAFVWRSGTMSDLNTLLPSGSGWILQSASGISDGGQIVGTGTLNGVTRAFLLTPPIDVVLEDRGVITLSDSNLPRGVEAGRSISFVMSAEAYSEDPLTVYGARLTDTLSGPAEYVSATSYDGGNVCQITPKTLTCDLPPFQTVGMGTELWVKVRTTGPGGISHTAVISGTTTPDPNGSNNSVSESNWAVALSAMTLTPATLAGGKASSAKLTLTSEPPSGDAVVRLASSRPDIAAVPATVVVPYFAQSTSRTFNIIPQVVSAPTPVEISATYGLVTIKQTLTVVPPALTQLSLMPTTIIGGCGTSAGKISLSGSAPSGGAVVMLSNANAKASAPASVTVAGGASTATFTVSTSTVTTSSTGKITASFGGVAKTLDVTVRPIRAKTLALSPNPATGGSTVSGTVTLECAAPAGGTVVSMSSSNSTVAAPTATSVTIPAGATTASFSVRTTRPAASTSVSIYAMVYGVRKSATLTVKP